MGEENKVRKLQVDSTYVHANKYKTPKEYLEAVIYKQVKQSDQTSQGANIFKDVKIEYKTKLLAEFRINLVKGRYGVEKPLKTADLGPMIKKNAI